MLDAMEEKLYQYLAKLPKENIINTMLSALDEMQACNGRTRTDCIVMALGGDMEEQPNGRKWYTLPGLSVAKKNTASFPL